MPLLAAEMLQFSGLSVFLIIGLTILALHFITVIIVAPRWIGPRVQVSPAAVIVGVPFFAVRALDARDIAPYRYSLK